MHRRIRLASILLICIFFIFSCASSNHSHKKLKRGKPIPCPLKDC